MCLPELGHLFWSMIPISEEELSLSGLVWTGNSGLTGWQTSGNDVSISVGDL